MFVTIKMRGEHKVAALVLRVESHHPGLVGMRFRKDEKVVPSNLKEVFHLPFSAGSITLFGLRQNAFEFQEAALNLPTHGLKR